MTDSRRHLLVVEDNPGDVGLIEDYLEDCPQPWTLASARRLDDAIDRLRNGTAPDAVLLDLGLPDSQGLDTLRRLAAAAGDLPIIVLTGQDDRALAVKALQQGARDFLVKDGLGPDNLNRAVAAAVDHVAAERQHRRIEDALRESEERFRSAFVTAPHGMALAAPDGRFLSANKTFCDLVGYSEAELLDMNFRAITHPDDLESDLWLRRQLLAGDVRSFQMEKRYIRKDGVSVVALLSVSLVRSTDGRPVHFVSQVFDLTERKDLERRLRQAQKMEAVGQLTGGIAHDFNNLLGVIVGNLELLERPVAGDARARKRVKAALFAAERGAELTRQLLAFSRRQALEVAVVDVNQLVDGMGGLLRQTLGEAIVLEIHHCDDLWPTRIDAAQLESALLNLALNARDAMPAGGCLTIETDNVWLDGSDVAEDEDMAPGDYVLIAVSDNGTGIPHDLIGRVFEPFFTTKEVGHGSGLGLSMVFGYVKQSGGHVRIDSQEGYGTTVSLYLPRTQGRDEAVRETGEARPEAPRAGVGATILLVEDKPDMREIAVEMLADLGYRMLAAENGREALALLDDNPAIDLLLTDVIMPGGMTGPQLAQAACRRRPGLNVLYMSGYAETAILQDGEAGPRGDLIGKPFRRTELASKVRAAIAGV